MRQADSDLRLLTMSLPAASIRRIAAGMGLRRVRTGDLQKRVGWYFRGKAPLSALAEDPPVLGAVMMASALPEEDFDAFLAATALLLLERLRARNVENHFWTWPVLSEHYRLASPEIRSALMCGFREAQRIGTVDLGADFRPGDCLTLDRQKVLGRLRAHAGQPLPDRLRTMIEAEDGPSAAGALWAASHGQVEPLAEGVRRATLAGFRYLYERPVSMEPPAGSEVPVLPPPG